MLARTSDVLLSAADSPLLRRSAASAALLLFKGHATAALPHSGCPAGSTSNWSSVSQAGRSFASMPKLVPTVSKQPANAAAIALPKAAVFGSSNPADNEPIQDELPLWHHLRDQEGFSQDTIYDMQNKKYIVKKYLADKVQRDLAPSIAALRKEGLTTDTLELMYEAQPALLTTTHGTLMSSLAVLRDLADQLGSKQLRPYDPPFTRLGAALRDYPGSGTYLLTRTSSYITSTQQLLQDELDVSSAEFAAALFKNRSILVRDTASAQRMAKHLLQVYNGDKKQGEAALGCLSQCLIYCSVIIALFCACSQALCPALLNSRP
jgi:hypothetical protein